MEISLSSPTIIRTIGNMANLVDAVQQYPFLEALCPYLRIADFKALSRTNSIFRLCMTGRNTPILPKQKTAYPYQPVSRPCSCKKNLFADCPKHGLPELRNLLGKIDRTCEDPNHWENGSSSPSMPGNWKTAICDALSGLSNVNSCIGCTRTICFQCWWSYVTTACQNTRGNGRAQYACSTCWDADFEQLRNGNPSFAFPTTHGHRTWRQAQLQGDFCKCGPAILCRSCTENVKPPQSYTPFEQRYRLSCSSHKKCIACPTYMSENETEKVNHFCPFCSLPMQMRNHDHILDRQSQKFGVYHDDINEIDLETRRVGPDYESVQEFWKSKWNASTGARPPMDPPTDWKPVEYEWERFNNASVLTAEERSHFDPCSYFKPIRAPAWDSEKVLFTPPPIKLSGNRWRSIFRGAWTLRRDPRMYTREEFVRANRGESL